MNVKLFLSTEIWDPIAAIIRWHEDALWSHTGWRDVDTGRTFSAMADGKGVAWREPNPHAKILMLNALGTDEAFQEALKFEGSGYDYLEILGIMLGRDWQTPGRVICSHLTFPQYAKVGKPLLNHTFIQFEKLIPSYTLLSPFVSEAA
ncbi:MAG: hypothetical protein JWQ87_5487 [Candidatus Sulfotelmatobacter sp.]|nr:hypothetical protein [Candidatus Sulfotelmatobacter sp.]